MFNTIKEYCNKHIPNKIGKYYLAVSLVKAIVARKTAIIKTMTN